MRGAGGTVPSAPWVMGKEPMAGRPFGEGAGSGLGRWSPRGAFRLSPECGAESGQRGGSGPGCGRLCACLQAGEVGTRPDTAESPEWQGRRVC